MNNIGYYVDVHSPGLLVQSQARRFLELKTFKSPIIPCSGANGTGISGTFYSALTAWQGHKFRL